MPAHPDPLARLEELVQKKAQLEARMEAIDARQGEIDRKNDDRITWLLGSLVYERLGDNSALQDFVRRELPGRLTDRDHKRGLWQRLFPEDTGGPS
ncbi:mobilization protein (plasmid) [Paracoccus yeei]